MDELQMLITILAGIAYLAFMSIRLRKLEEKYDFKKTVFPEGFTGNEVQSGTAYADRFAAHFYMWCLYVLIPFTTYNLCVRILRTWRIRERRRMGLS